MEIILAIVTGALYATGLYLMLRRSVVRLVIGLSLISHAANLLIFSAAGMTRARPPIVPEGAVRPEAPFADPVPQALILTSIVLGFAILAFAMVLIKRAYQTVGTDDLDAMRSTDE
jgi:multicomponent Na+:H+ antiporter subunit C